MMITRSEILTEMYRLCFDQQLDPKGWRTNENGKHYHIDSEGRIDAGFGGKFNGLKPSEIGKVKELESRQLTGMALPNQIPEVLSKHGITRILSLAKSDSNEIEEIIGRARSDAWGFVEEKIDSGKPEEAFPIIKDATDLLLDKIQDAVQKGDNELALVAYKLHGELANVFHKTKVVAGTKDGYISDWLGKYNADYENALKENGEKKSLELFDASKKYIAIASSTSQETFFSDGSDTSEKAGIYFNLDKDRRGYEWEKPFQALSHESGHNIDLLLGDGYRYFSTSFKNGALENAAREDVERLRHNFHRRLNELWRDIRNGEPKDSPNFDKKLIAFREAIAFKFKVDESDSEDVIQAIKDPKNKRGQVMHPSIDGLYGKTIKNGYLHKNIAPFSDILHGVSYKPELKRSTIWCGFGHPEKIKTRFGEIPYWEAKDAVPKEIFAELFCAYTANDGARKHLRKMMHGTTAVFDEMLEFANEKLRKKEI